MKIREIPECRSPPAQDEQNEKSWFSSDNKKIKTNQKKQTKKQTTTKKHLWKRAAAIHLM